MINILDEITSSLRKSSILASCGAKKCTIKNTITIDNIDLARAIGMVISWQMDATAKSPLDVLLVNASRIVWNHEIKTLRGLKKILAVTYHLIGIGCYDDIFSEKIKVSVRSAMEGIELGNIDIGAVEDFFSDIISLYAKLYQYKIIDQFPMVNVAYNVILDGHLPIDLIKNYNKEYLLVY